MAGRQKDSPGSSRSRGRSLRAVSRANSPVPTNEEVLQLGRWWREYKGQPLDEITDKTTLATALADVGVLALGYLARRLTNEQTPEHVRDRIALALGPRMLVQLHRGVGGDVEHPDEGAGLLADYSPPHHDA